MPDPSSLCALSDAESPAETFSNNEADENEGLKDAIELVGLRKHFIRRAARVEVHRKG